MDCIKELSSKVNRLILIYQKVQQNPLEQRTYFYTKLQVAFLEEGDMLYAEQYIILNLSCDYILAGMPYVFHLQSKMFKFKVIYYSFQSVHI